MIANLSTLILAGGRGKRMGSLCNDRPKPCLPFGGHFHVIDFCLSNCLNSCIQEIAALVDYQRESMIDYLGLWQASNPYSPQFAILPPGPTLIPALPTRYTSIWGTCPAPSPYWLWQPTMSIKWTIAKCWPIT